MARLGQKGRILKWAGLAMSLVILAVYLASGFLFASWGWRPSDYQPHYYTDHTEAEGESRILILENGCLYLYQGNAHDSQLTFIVRDSSPPDEYGEHGIDLWPEKGSTAVPLWMPFVIVALPTAFLWWCDRRCVPPGHCQSCGYDLTGNVSGVCPECGVKT